MAQLIKDEDVTLVVQSLVGSIPSTDISLEDFREERLRKYEAVINGDDLFCSYSAKHSGQVALIRYDV